MPPPISEFPPRVPLPQSELLMLSRYRLYIRKRSSQLLYIEDGGRMYFLPRHYWHSTVYSRRVQAKRKARDLRRSQALLPREYRSMIYRKIIGLRTLLLDGASIRDVSLRSGIPSHVLRPILLGRRDPPLSLAIRVANSLGVKVRSLGTYIHRVKSLRARSLLPLPYPLSQNVNPPQRWGQGPS